MKMNIGSDAIIQFYAALNTSFFNRESRVSKCHSLLDISNFSLNMTDSFNFSVNFKIFYLAQFLLLPEIFTFLHPRRKKIVYLFFLRTHNPTLSKLRKKINFEFHELNFPS